jgi:hypothetical protein
MINQEQNTNGENFLLVEKVDICLKIVQEAKSQSKIKKEQPNKDQRQRNITNMDKLVIFEKFVQN